MRRDAVHLIAKRAVTKPPEHPAVFEIEIQHVLGSPLSPGKSRTERKVRYYVAAKFERAAESAAPGTGRHISASDTYMRIALEPLLHHQRQ